MTIYTVTAYRFGNIEDHSYIVGVFITPQLAREAADTEHSRRAGKYAISITEHDPDSYDPENFKLAKEVYRRRSSIEIWRERQITH